MAKGTTTFFALALLSNNGIATELLPWKTWKEDASMKVSYRASQYDGLMEINASAKAQSSLAGFLFFIDNYPNIPRWLDNAKSANLIKQISTTENIFVTRFHGFWPVDAREMVTHSRFWQNADLSVEIKAEDASEALDKSSEIIRMRLYKAHWKITPITSQQIHINYTFVVDPQGHIPQWLSKKVTLKGVWRTLKNIQQQLPAEKWQQLKRDDIKEFTKRKLLHKSEITHEAEIKY